jgi:dihydrofolate reductase
MATSIDGCITRGGNDTDWVSESDWSEFKKQVKSQDAVIMGKKTMEQFGDNFPVEGPTNVVLTRSTEGRMDTDELVYFSGEPQDLVNRLSEMGPTNLLLIGGANTNDQFLAAGLIDEIILSVHPLVIGKGLHLFGDEELDAKLQLVETKTISNELVQIRFSVQK